CLEDLVSTTRYVSWSLRNKDSFGGTEHSNVNNPTATTLPQTNPQEKEDTQGHLASGTDSSTSVQSTETKLADLLDSTLWNRRLARSPERIVYGLVQQIFHGIREYFLVSTELKHNCFLLMPIVDKLPALLREDLESAFEDDLDNIFDITKSAELLWEAEKRYGN
ncbi:ARP2/3 actin-organizing complex subunit Arc5, partial [Stylosanthes scabra]|nr:ARP2/3 actin-organizing complex subunit Arc5 [Stylosanthes scabra]